MARTIHVNVLEAFLGPKKTSATIRAYVKYKLLKILSGREFEETDRDSPESDVSQRNAHGYHIWVNNCRQYEVPEPNEGPSNLLLEVHADNLIRGDELIGSGIMDQNLIYQLLTVDPGVVREFDVPLKPSDELIHMNDDGGMQEVYNYRLRVRVLVTPAGVEPTADDRARLDAPSAHFDATKEEEGDEDNNIGLVDTAMAVKSELGRWPIFRAVKLILFAALALFSGITSIVTMVMELAESEDTDWKTSNPQDGKRCVAFFDKAEAVRDDADNAVSTMLYNYNLQNTSVAFCTDATEEKMNEKMGASYFFDAAKDVMGPDCALSSATAQTNLKDHCSPAATCGDAFDTVPAPYGIMWKYTIEKNNASTEACASIVSEMDVIDWPDCDKANVFVYRQVRSKAAYGIFIFSVIFTWVRMALEFVGVINYECQKMQECGPNGTMAVLFRVAFRGLCGPVYYLYLMIKTRNTVLPVVIDPPIVVDLLLLIGEAVPNIVLPIYAIIGCTTANVWLLVLLIFGIVKVVVLVLSKVVMFVLTHTAEKEVVDSTEILEVKEAI